jgi:hypothetical protein
MAIRLTRTPVRPDRRSIESSVPTLIGRGNGKIMAAKRQDPAPAQPLNAATHTVVSTLGVLLGISSIDHGVLEILQGNSPTPGLLVKALGPGHSWSLWTHGSEPAFTLVHNFLLTGILAVLFGILLIVWSAGFIHRRGGPTVFLLLSIASFVTGGGMAQWLIFTLNWAAATRIHSPLTLVRRAIPGLVRRALGQTWKWALAASALVFLAALEIAAIGYFPGLPRDTQALTRILWQLAAAIIAAILLAIAGALAADAEARSSKPLDQA